MITPLRRPLGVALAVVAFATGIAACGTTVDEDATGGTDATVVRDADGETATDAGTPTTTVVLAGTAIELLPEIVGEMSRLSAEIGGYGDEDATLARIEQAWAAIRDEIETTRPELVGDMQTTIDMARTAVTANRPADADKALSILTDLIAAY